MAHVGCLIEKAVAGVLAVARGGDGQYAEAERIEPKVLGVKRPALGEEHPHTLTSAGNLASSLSCQAKHAEAERIDREVLGYGMVCEAIVLIPGTEPGA
jgi:hypothetical protein